MVNYVGNRCIKMRIVDYFSNIMAALWYDNQPECVICHEKQGPVCSTCREAYFLPKAARCWCCGKIMPATQDAGHEAAQEYPLAKEQNNRLQGSGKDICRDCRAGRGPQSLARVTVLGHFFGGWRDFIHTVKYRRNPQLLTLVTEDACGWAGQYLPVPDIITSVPMHIEKIRQRGFNQAQVLASLMAWRLAVPYQPLMRRKTQNVTQMGLGRKERLQNLNNAYSLNKEYEDGKNLKGRVCWLIDDVTTTGATLEQGAQTLLNGGARQVYGFCLAAALQDGKGLSARPD